MASSHLIGLVHLPYYQHVASNVTFLSLDPRFEKAMLVRNVNGDYAIIKGKWMGLKRDIAPHRDKNGRMIRGVRGSLKIEIYSILKQSIQTIQINDRFVFELENEYFSTKTDLKSGRIEFNFSKKTIIANLEVESVLAVIFR
jgi:hypothetical protein